MVAPMGRSSQRDCKVTALPPFIQENIFRFDQKDKKRAQGHYDLAPHIVILQCALTFT